MTEKKLPGKYLITKDNVQYRISKDEQGREVINGFIKSAKGHVPVSTSKAMFHNKRSLRNLAVLMGTGAEIKGKGYGPAIMEIRNRYILGDLKIKPPFKIKKVVVQDVESPTVAQKHLDFGLIPGPRVMFMKNHPEQDRIKNLDKAMFDSIEYSAIRKELLEKTRYEYKSHWWSKPFIGKTFLMKERLKYLKKQGKGFGNRSKRRKR